MIAQNAYLNALRQPNQKFWPKILTPYFFYSNLYLHYLRPCCENIFKIVCTVSEKIEKNVSQFDLFFASSSTCLQFQWNWEYFFSAVWILCGRLLMASWHGFYLLDRERWIRLIPPQVRRTSPWFANFSSISAAIVLLLKIFCQDNKFFYFKSISSFLPYLCPGKFPHLFISYDVAEK